MKDYRINTMIMDEDDYDQEAVTAYFTHNNKEFSITFSKGNLEIINNWAFENETSVPANLSNELIEAIREDIKSRI